MGTTSTKDVKSTIDQIMRCADEGFDLVRVTVVGMKDAKACHGIRETLDRKAVWSAPLAGNWTIYCAVRDTFGATATASAEVGVLPLALDDAGLARVEVEMSERLARSSAEGSSYRPRQNVHGKLNPNRSRGHSFHKLR